MKRAWLWVALLAALLATYSNHFNNSFHFDDAHTIIDNPYIRDLRFVPRFFTDARTLSVLPEQQGYRPLLPASFAVDYWLAGGLRSRWFHASTFAWYLVLLAGMYWLFTDILNRTRPDPRNGNRALFAVALYALHPVSAETVNYIWQRAEIYATLSVVAAFILYLALPAWRRFGLYLIPSLLGMLAKQSATMFAPLLFVYLLLFESPKGSARSAWPSWADLVAAARRSAPAFLLSGAYYFFQRAMTASTFDAGGYSPRYYWYTQPVVLLDYFTKFFVPTHLSADSDRQFVTSALSVDFVFGVAFLAVLLLVIWQALRTDETRPVAFGLLWFLIASLPTSLLPLGELENDHRMFFPFVGVALAVTWGGCLLVERAVPDRVRHLGFARISGTVALLLVLTAGAYGAHARNDVWRSEETLWKDVTIKSPRNGRGLMNYGLQLMARADYPGALQYFERAKGFLPNYHVLHINLGIAYGGVRNDQQAEAHFKQAIALSPRSSDSHFFYARWLRERSRTPAAVEHLQQAIALNANDLQSAHLLMQVYAERGDAANVKALATSTLRQFPSDTMSAEYVKMDVGDPWSAAVEAVRQHPTPEGFLDLSLKYEQAGRHDDCIRAAQEALKLRPDYAEAYNNIAAANLSLKRWAEAIDAAQHAVRLKPGFQLAANNLRYAQQQAAAGSKPTPQ